MTRALQKRGTEWQQMAVFMSSSLVVIMHPLTLGPYDAPGSLGFYIIPSVWTNAEDYVQITSPSCMQNKGTCQSTIPLRRAR